MTTNPNPPNANTDGKVGLATRPGISYLLNCLSHTSGVPDIFPGSPAAALVDWIAAASPEEALKKVGAVPLLYKTGKKSIRKVSD
jgi:CubicO group peptidase (beta-lactamase class C family)